jgi:hypothetical protein
MQRLRHTILVSFVVAVSMSASVGWWRGEADALEPQRLTLEQLVEVATENNPQIKAARERWGSALHEIKQNYVPVDPTFSYSSVDSPRISGFQGLAAYN